MGRLIGIAGAAGSGKDTAAAALVEIGFTRDAFADRMRKAILALDPIVDSWDPQWSDREIAAGARPGPVLQRLSELVGSIGWDQAKRETPEVRRLLQKFGTEAGRDIHGTNCWVDLVLEPWYDSPCDLAITDVRFENEAKAVREAGGIVVQILRPGLEGLTGVSGGHASEAGFPEELLDARIVNEGTIENLYEAIIAVCRYFYPEGN